MTALRGMTWNHPRGFDPMVATSGEWAKRTGVEIVWEKRSLQDFETYPVEELARSYDLIVIDHPHVGQITAEGCLLPLDVEGRDAERAALALGSVGASYESYAFGDRQWAFPIDAAAQIMAFRPDRIKAPQNWSEVLALAREHEVTLPLLPPHNLMSFLTLSANLGAPCSTEPGVFAEPERGAEAVALLQEIVALVDPVDFSRDPIAASEALAGHNAKVSAMPLGYGYVNYAIDGFRPHRLAFTDIPLPQSRGSALGGTGIAVSAFSEHPQEALDYAYWVASAAVQSGLYASAGGQPGHAAAWEAESVNMATGNFYRATRTTLERAYVRPRHDGYMAFQTQASRRLDAGLRRKDAPSAIVSDLNRLFEESF